jgi:hypothetical protein
MPKFMDVHDGFVGVTAGQLNEAHQRDLAVEATEGVHFERAWLDPETGKVFCLSSGPRRRRYCGCTRRPDTRPGRSTSCRSRPDDALPKLVVWALHREK